MAQSQQSGGNDDKPWVAVNELGDVIGGPFDSEDEAWDWLESGGNYTGFAEPHDPMVHGETILE